MKKDLKKALQKLPSEVMSHFKSSGLDEATLAIMGVNFVAANSGELRLPVPAARIPYFDLDGREQDFGRLRILEEWQPEGAKKSRRYMQAPGSGNHLYLPPLTEKPWRAIAADPSIEVLITEGEKKAACACRNGFPTIGLGGVWNWRTRGVPIADLGLFTWKGRRVYVVFDSPDVRRNPAVASAIEHLASELRRRGADVRIGELPYSGDQKVGLDDFLVHSGRDALVDVLAKAPEYLDPIAEMNGHLALVWHRGRSLVMRESRRSDGKMETDFARHQDVKPGYAGRTVLIPGENGDRRVDLFKYWVEHPRSRRYDRVVFQPAGCSDNEYNLWRGFAVTPLPGDCSLYLAHIRNVICQNDPILFTYVIAWMAQIIQKPSELCGTALVLRGKQGAGKGMFAHIFGALLGQHFLHVSSERHLLGNFNGHTKDALLLFADEAFWAGNKSAEGTLKALVTEPTRIIEHKGWDALIIDNFIRLIIASNHDWVVPAGLEERRFVILDVGDDVIGDTEYFRNIKEQMLNGGNAALMDFLLNVDISGINLRKIPKTAGLLETKLMSLKPLEIFWYECLMAGSIGGNGIWPTEVPCHVLHELYLHQHPNAGRRAAQSELGRTLKRLVPGLDDVRRQARSPSQGQERNWVLPSLEACRRAFCIHIGQEVPWDLNGGR
jgi:hypothetical protein